MRSRERNRNEERARRKQRERGGGQRKKLLNPRLASGWFFDLDLEEKKKERKNSTLFPSHHHNETKKNTMWEFWRSRMSKGKTRHRRRPESEGEELT